MGRALRADAERSVRLILEAAERVLAADPGATLEQIAEAAGVARTTVHRRFANRQALLEALTESAERQLAEAIEEARPDTAPPLVALHRVTANVLRVKGAWSFALGHPAAQACTTGAVWAGVNARCLELFGRAQREGLFHPEADLEWTRRVYYALIGEALNDARGRDPESLAALVADTLLHGVGQRPGAP
ncbi:TetR/AcrR family transcriptional regulator [Streptomyces bluensis]|uniref:TetR/AcrR family transcriptional regulator n=1 Tax=Streptomyces bluensis TaxID=33897 RepID=A0ABW6US52_9ACTN|nr:TetR/AcrR family transcriptional regulator [Streptomyces bluensis]GGZ73421.1 transcriptional regulator [Streptomyces bluensis]